MATFERLTALDATFLAIDERRSVLNTCFLLIFDESALRSPDGSLDRVRLREHAELQVLKLPRFRRRLSAVPFVRHPVLIDDPDFDLDRHLKFITLSRGDEHELRELVAKVAAEPLDRSQALWQIWYIDGLAGQRFAALVKVHQSLIGGLAGTSAFDALLDSPPSEGPLSVQRRSMRPPSAHAKTALVRAESQKYRATLAQLGADLRERVERATGPLSAARSVCGGALAAAGSIAELVGTARAVAREPVRRRKPNPGVRTTEWLDFESAQLVEVASARGAVLSDVLVALVASAIQRGAARRGQSASRPYRALVGLQPPIRGAHEPLARISLTPVELPVQEPEPELRLRRALRELAASRAKRAASSLEIAERIADLTFVNWATIAARLSMRRGAYDAIVVELPELRAGASLLGAKLEAIYPLAPLYLHSALCIAHLSYGGRLYCGLTADGARGIAVNELATDVLAELSELRRRI